MGPLNERRVYDALVQTARHESSAQYFLLTPKVIFLFLNNAPFDFETNLLLFFFSLSGSCFMVSPTASTVYKKKEDYFLFRKER